MKTNPENEERVAEIVQGLSSELTKIYDGENGSTEHGNGIKVVMATVPSNPSSQPEVDRATLIWRFKHWIVGIAGLAALITFGVSNAVPATYSSSTTIRVAGQPVNGSLSSVVTAS